MIDNIYALIGSERSTMKEYQTIIFFDEDLVFQSKKNKNKKLILNYRSQDIAGFIKGVQIENLENTYYYEINLEKALKIITNKRELEYNKVERYCLTFLKCLLDETSDSLICFLQKETKLSREELFDLELEFTSLKKKLYYPKRNKKVETP